MSAVSATATPSANAMAKRPRPNVEASQDGAPAERGARNGREERAPRGERNEGRRERRNEAPRGRDDAPVAAGASARWRAGGAVEIGSAAVKASGRCRTAPRRRRAPRPFARPLRPRPPRAQPPRRRRSDAQLRCPMPAPVGATTAIAVETHRRRRPRAERAAVAALAARSWSRPKPPRSRALPKVQPFELPLDELAQVAEGSGLALGQLGRRTRGAGSRCDCSRTQARPRASRAPARDRASTKALWCWSRPAATWAAMVLPFEQQPGRTQARH